MHRMSQAPREPDTFGWVSPEDFQSTPPTELIFPTFFLSLLASSSVFAVSINGSKKLLAEKMTCYRMGKKYLQILYIWQEFSIQKI